MTTLPEAHRNDPISDNHILLPLEFESIDEVPESHSWPLFDKPLQDLAIPVIDLNDPNAMNLIGQACEKWGMFQVINHGVPSELVKRAECEARRLFALPANEKCRVLRSNGATGYGSAQISPFYDKRMWHEGFTIMGSCVDHAKVLWPHDYLNFCDTMDAYQNQMKLVTQNLLLMILQYLDVTQEEIHWATSSHDSIELLQLNSYPPCPNPSQTIGLAPHSDISLLTLVHQGGINGLEIFVEGLGWTPVQAVEGAIVVTVGDHLHIFSNATFPVASHRAMVNQSKHRISLAYFHGLQLESRVGPSSKFHKPCVKSMLVKEYVSLKDKHFFEALSLIRK